MPDWKTHIRSKLKNAGLDAVREEEIAEELAQQMEGAYWEAKRAGLDHGEATRTALSEIEDWEVFIRELRSVERPLASRLLPSGKSSAISKGWLAKGPRGFLSDLRQDFRIALRGMSRRPVLAVAMIVTLALGIGANTSIFSVVYGSWLNPLPFPEPNELVRVFIMEDERPLPMSVADFTDLSSRSTTVESMAAHTASGVLLSDGREWELIQSATVTTNFFELLGLSPQLGRDFSPEDGRPGADPVLILSHALWEKVFAGDPEIIGKEVHLRDGSYLVVGVASPRFSARRTPYGPTEARLFLPFRWQAESLQNRGARWIFPVARLKEGITVGAANEEFKQLYRAISQEHAPERLQHTTVEMEPFSSWSTADNKTSLVMLTGAALLVLLIAAFNVANLLLVRFESRNREIMIRAALGAPRWRLAQSFLTESLLLGGLACLTGVLSAVWGTDLIVGLYSDSLARASQIGIHGPVLAFSLLLSLAIAFLIVAVPVSRLRMSRLHDSLKAGGRRSPKTGNLPGKGLVAAQIAVTVILVSGAGLLLHSLWKLNRVDLGVDLDNVMAFYVTLPDSGYEGQASREAFYRDLLENLQGAIGIKQVGLANRTPFEQQWSSSISAEDGEHRVSNVPIRQTSSGFFRTLGIPLHSGRLYETPLQGSAAREAGSQVALVSSGLADELFPAGQAVGRHLVVGEDKIEVIGIVGDVREFGPDQDKTPSVYIPALSLAKTMRVVVRTAAGFESADEIRRAVASSEPQAAIWDFAPLRDQAAGKLTHRRLTLVPVVLFAAAALALAIVGIYGVIAHMVTSTTREIGTRLALGADPGTIMKEVVGKGLRIAVIGIPLGLAGAAGLGHVLRGLLWDLSPFDPLTLASVVATVMISILAACLLPARRAARVDPLEALRCE